MTDLLLRGGTVVTMDPARRVIADGAVGITGTSITFVGPASAAPPAREVIDTPGHAILPGLIDAHAHAGHGLVKTLGNGRSGVWMDACAAIYTRFSPPAFWRAEARLAALERLRFGVTTGLSLLGGGDSVMRTDTPAHGDAHMEGVREIGIRDIMAIGPTRPPHPRTYADAGGHEYAVPFGQQLDTCGALIERWHGTHDGCSFVATLMPVHRIEHGDDPAMTRTVERQGRAIRELGQRHGTLFHQDGHRAGSIEVADRVFGLLGPDASLSHCTDLTDADMDALARTGAAVVHNPSAIASVRGYCPVPALLARGVPTILGSDGTAPDRSTDMFRHMAMARRVHQREHRDETLLPPGQVLAMCTIDAAAALGLGNRLGSLEVGKLADVITVDLHQAHLYPPNMPVWRLACFASGQDVRTAVVNGRVLMRDRVVPHVDEADVLAAAAAATEVMLDRAGLRAEVEEGAAVWGRNLG